MTKKITPLLNSMDTRMIGSRFMVKISTMDNGVHPKSIMCATQDLVSKGFSLKFFKLEEDVTEFVKILSNFVK